MHLYSCFTSFLSLSSLFILLPTLSLQQSPSAAVPQLTSFNSTFNLTTSQITKANFSDVEADSINNIINFERSQYAGSPSSSDAFYTIPSNLDSSSLAAGSLLRVEDPTNITTYALSPNLALSRILYTSLTLNNTPVPASAFILWPFTPRLFSFTSKPNASSPAPAILWTHMTSGFFPPASPSKHRTLFAGDSAPFALALAGYAVIAPDYAGLGVSRGFNNETPAHQYLSSPASANDAVYALAAARKAFASRLTEEFVVMGQSQGGGVAWGVAELLAKNTTLIKGHLGSIAVGPTTEIFSGASNYIAPFVGFGLSSVFPEFKLSDWLTDVGLGRAEVLREVQGGLATALGFFTTSLQIAKDGFNATWEAQKYSELSNAGRKKVSGPLLVVQGTEDVFIPYDVTSETVEATCEMVPGNQIEYLVSNETGHVPTLFSTRQIWMRWIEERFEGKEVEEKGCGHTTVLESFLPIERYQKTWNSFAQWAGAPQYSYEVPLAL